MLLEDYGGWIGTKLMARMPKVHVGTLESARVSFTGGKTDIKGSISRHLRMTRRPDDHIRCVR